MLIRLVHMTFRPDAVDAFLELFDASCDQIRSFHGCRHLELWQDADRPNVFTTYSHWTDAAALDAYRNSDLFRSTWRRAKALFASPPEARSHLLIRPLTIADSA